MNTIEIHRNAENAGNGSATRAGNLERPHGNGGGTHDIDAPDLICLSHLRWDFVYQRPQHLLTRCAQKRRVFFVEEPIFGDGPVSVDVSRRDCGVWIVVPHLPHGMEHEQIETAQQGLLDVVMEQYKIRDYVAWYYTPMALGFTSHLKPAATIYDCMDELSAFHGAPPALRNREQELFRRADLVFTGGHSLYEAKKDQHKSVHAFPSSIDMGHFAQARQWQDDPADQADIPHPRVGFFGVIDERMDIDLLAGIADARPDWHLVMIGPVVKIDPATLPQRENIHFIGGKHYSELPGYLAGWDLAMLPFARNESTRYISPTKTPEYLAAGKPVVSTSIRDVINPYATMGMVEIADTPEEFVNAAETAMANGQGVEWLRRIDTFLKDDSWDNTWERMNRLIKFAVKTNRSATADNGIQQMSILSQRAQTAANGIPSQTH
ncbi:MAG: glycosyltransferase family 1 protein [Bacteroidota bacterium]